MTGLACACRKAESGKAPSPVVSVPAPVSDICPAGYEVFENEWYRFCKPLGFKAKEGAKYADISLYKEGEPYIHIREYVSSRQLWEEYKWIKPDYGSLPPDIHDEISSADLPLRVRRAIVGKNAEEIYTDDKYKALLWYCVWLGHGSSREYIAAFILPSKHMILVRGKVKSLDMAQSAELYHDRIKTMISTFKMKIFRPVTALTKEEFDKDTQNFSHSFLSDKKEK